MFNNIKLSSLLFLGLFLMPLPEAQSIEYTKEAQLTTRLSNEIKHFWQQGLFASFNGVEKIRINYAAFTQLNEAECIVVVTGRSESYLKYQELAFDLYQQGFNVFLIDHRGQGLSQRLLTNHNKGYVKDFDHYANDLHQFITDIVNPGCTNGLNGVKQKKTHLLAHSMGGAIAIRMMQLFPLSVKSAVLTSPMIAVNNGKIPNWLAKTIIYSGNKLDSWFSDEANYFMGQKGFATTPFTENELTQSSVRYQHFAELYQNNKEIQLGGVTTHWLAESIVANKNIFADLDKLSTPILLMQSGKDTVVSNEAQNEFCQQLYQINKQYCPDGKPFVIENALHELLFEQDQYRTPAIDKALTWFRTYSN
jgi:lysophospholipase